MEGGALDVGAADKVFKFYDDYIKSARDYWTPDPESVSEAGRLIGGIASFLPYVALGPAAGPAIVGSSTFGTAADLVESGVDAATATGMGVLGGAATGLMVALPASGKALTQTLALIGANPVLGAVQEGIQKKALIASGYEAQARMFDPFDPVNRSLDLIMGGIFGGLSHYGAARRKRMPIQFEDALDVAAHAQKVAKNNPLEGSRGAVAHDAALNKAITDVTEGRPVDVAEVVKDAPLKAEVPVEPETAKVREAVAKEVARIESDVMDNDLNQRGFVITETETARLIDVPAASKIEKGVKVVSEYPALKAQDLYGSEVTAIEEAKRLGRDYYNRLEAEPVSSPAFHGQLVSFTEHGWLYITDRNYLKRLEQKKRFADEEVVRRVKLLPKAKVILQQAPYADEVREVNGNKRYGLLGRFEDGSVIRVVVEETEKDGRHFYSVFDLENASKKLKKTPPSSQSSGSGGYGVDGEPSTRTIASDSTITPSSGEVKADVSSALKGIVHDGVKGETGVPEPKSKTVRSRNWDDVLDAELEAEVGRIIGDYPDTALHMGTDETGAARIRPAAEVIDEARQGLTFADATCNNYKDHATGGVGKMKKAFFSLCLVFLIGILAAVANAAGPDAAEAEVDYRATIRDDQDIATKVSKPAWDGDEFFTGARGKGTITISFSKVKKVVFMGSAGPSKTDFQVTLKNGDVIAVTFDNDARFMGKTNYGTYRILARNIKEISFE